MFEIPLNYGWGFLNNYMYLLVLFLAVLGLHQALLWLRQVGVTLELWRLGFSLQWRLLLFGAWALGQAASAAAAPGL